MPDYTVDCTAYRKFSVTVRDVSSESVARLVAKQLIDDGAIGAVPADYDFSLDTVRAINGA